MNVGFLLQLPGDGISRAWACDFLGTPPTGQRRLLNAPVEEAIESFSLTQEDSPGRWPEVKESPLNSSSPTIPRSAVKAKKGTSSTARIATSPSIPFKVPPATSEMFSPADFPCYNATQVSSIILKHPKTRAKAADLKSVTEIRGFPLNLLAKCSS